MVVGCAGGSRGRSLSTVTTVAAPVTSSSSSTTTSTTMVAPATSVTPPPTSATTPQARATAFYEAWTRGDRAAAMSLGEPEAVATLFARTWSVADGWSFSECSGAAGSLICAWQRPSGQLLLRVRNATGGLPVSVTDVRFS